MSALRCILNYEVCYNFKSRRRLAAGAMLLLLGAVMVSGLYAVFHDESWQTGANNSLYPVASAWTDMTEVVVANSILLPNAYAQPPSSAFVTTWNITGPPTSAPSSLAEVKFSIGVESGGEVHVDWGDGDTDTYNATGEPRHYYTNLSPGTPTSATVAITGDLQRFYFDYDTRLAVMYDTPQLLLSVDQWGDTQWSSMEAMFRDAVNMQYEATDAPDLSSDPDVLNMFYKTEAFDGDLSNWDVSLMTSLHYMFNKAYAFNGDISDWNVSGVTDMTYMFAEAYAFNGDISDWNVSGVTDMDYMFYQAYAFNADISGWDVSKVTDLGAIENMRNPELFQTPR